MSKAPTIIAHRGFSQYYEESSLQAFSAAKEIGADMVEFDLHETSDSHFIVTHPIGPNGRGLKWSELTLETIKQLPQHPPGFADCIDVVKPLPIALEVKSYRMEASVEKLLRTTNLPHGSFVCSFDYGLLQHLYKAHIPLPMFLIIAISFRRTASQIIRGSHILLTPSATADFLAGLVVNERLVTQGLVHSLHKLGKLVHVWTVDDTKRAKKLASWGVDGIITNRPDLILSTIVKGKGHGRTLSPTEVPKASK